MTLRFVAGYFFTVKYMLKIEGAITALVTPIKKGGYVDYECLKRLILRQIRLKASAIVVLGTTGEASAMPVYEHKKILEYAVTVSDGKIPVISGCGSNDTAHAVEMTKFCKKIGATAGLSVTPYYNKTTQNGLIAHYFKIADEADFPLIVYNVPSRTGMDITTETYLKLIENPNIVGIKEASFDVNKLSSLSLISDKTAVYCGNDEAILPYFLSGAKGVISVVANIIPDKIQYVYKMAKAGKIKEAKVEYDKYYGFIKSLFSTVNPIPVKYAMSKLKLCENRLILPLLPIKSSSLILKELKKVKSDVLP